MIRRLLTLLLIAPITWTLAGAADTNAPPPTFASSEEEMNWIEEELKRKRKAVDRERARAAHYDREAQRLLFRDYGMARSQYRRAEQAQRRATEIEEEILRMESRRESLLGR